MIMMSKTGITISSKQINRKGDTIKPQPKASSNGDVTRSSTAHDIGDAGRCSRIHIKVCSPWCHVFLYTEDSLAFPKKVLFRDYLCLHPLPQLDLTGWVVSAPIFRIIGEECKGITSLSLDHVKGLSYNCFESIRGLKMLKSLSLVGVDCSLNNAIAQVIASFRKLKTLNLSYCTTDADVFKTLSLACSEVKTLLLTHCRGLDNFGLHSIGQWIQRFRRISSINLSGSPDFTDDGLLDLTLAGYNLIAELDVSHCAQLSTSALTGLRNKMPSLTLLSIHNMMSLRSSAFEWLTEGCLSLTHLNLSNSPELDDMALGRIGRCCFHLVSVHIARCLAVTDTGVSSFMEAHAVNGGCLESIDVSGCIYLTSLSVMALSRNASRLHSIKLNGLAEVKAPSLTQLWQQARALRHFEMCSSLSSSQTHRRSTMPHFSDAVIFSATLPSCTLEVVKLIGAFQVTDAGACVLVQQCTQLLHVELSYCHGISDVLLGCMSKHSSRLQTFIGTGCVQISSRGIVDLCSGCSRATLCHIEINGCHKVMDEGVTALSHLSNLEVLCIRGCDHVTDAAVIAVAAGCTKLTTLDITNLDYLSVDVLRALVLTCPHLRTLNGECCNFTTTDYQRSVDRKLAFARPARGKCRLEDLPRGVMRYNAYVLEIRRHEIYVRKIQRFGRYIIEVYNKQLAGKLAAKALVDNRRMFRLFRAAVRASYNEYKQEMKIVAASTLAIRMRQLYSIHLSRRKARVLRRERAATLLLQRVFRGFVGRKRSIARFRRLFGFYNKIGHLAHKYTVIRAVRRVHRQILLVQSFARMVPCYVRYLSFRYALRSIQTKYRYRLRRERVERQKAFQLREEVRLERERRDAAARFIQKNWKASFFNKSMSGFILTCCIYYRIDGDDRLWAATIIQKRWRGFIVRLKKWRAWRKQYSSNAAAVAIQSMVRRMQQRRKYLPWRDVQLRVRENWRRMAVSSRPKLRLGLVARVIQRCASRFIVVMRRYHASITIQTRARGNSARAKVAIMRLMAFVVKANKIKRAFQLYQLRRARKAVLARRHMAAYKIWMMMDPYFLPKRQKRKLIEDRVRMRDETNRLKRVLVLQRRTRTTDIIIERYRNMCANRIIRLFKRIRDKKREEQRLKLESRSKIRKKANNLVDHEKAKKAKAQEEGEARASGLMLAPVRALKVLAASAMSIVSPTELVPKKDESKFFNAVLKYQVKTILQIGIVDMHLTLGEHEQRSFEFLQKKNIKYLLPHYDCVPFDISGDLYLKIFLWVKHGSGADCICRIVVDFKPNGTSKAGMKVRAQQLLDQGIRVVYHDHVNFEIQGVRSVKQGKGDFAAREIRFTRTQEEFDSMPSDFTLVADLSRVGMTGCMWSNARIPQGEDNLYKFVRLSSNPWFDERLVRIAKSVSLTEADILRIRDVFDAIAAGRDTEQGLRIEDIFFYMEYPYSSIARWVFAAINPDSSKYVLFSEYVHMTSFYVMLGPKELTKFLFQCADTDSKGYLKRQQFDELMAELGEGGAFSIKNWQIQYQSFYNKTLGYMFIGNFKDFVAVNPGVLWQAQALQRKLMKVNLGIKYWENKMEQYRIVRQQLGIKLIE